MHWEYIVQIGLTEEECQTLVAALDSYIRRMLRDYNHKEQKGASVERLQERQARIEAAKELRDKINNEVETWQDTLK